MVGVEAYAVVFLILYPRPPLHKPNERLAAVTKYQFYSFPSLFFSSPLLPLRFGDARSSDVMVLHPKPDTHGDLRGELVPCLGS